MNEIFKKLQAILERERTLGNPGTDAVHVTPEDSLTLDELSGIQLAFAWYIGSEPQRRLNAAQALLAGMLHGCNGFVPNPEIRSKRVAAAIGEADALLAAIADGKAAPRTHDYRERVAADVLVRACELSVSSNEKDLLHCSVEDLRQCVLIALEQVAP